MSTKDSDGGGTFSRKARARTSTERSRKYRAGLTATQRIQRNEFNRKRMAIIRKSNKTNQNYQRKHREQSRLSMQRHRERLKTGFECEYEEGIPAEEKKFYIRNYPNIDQVTQKRLHCTSCDEHIGSAPAAENYIRMHPILKTTQCRKCFHFYNSGEFDKGEDGSELYCRWCGQGGDVYCCADCPYVFCKKCIIANLSKACVKAIESNDNWKCFSCEPKIMWHLRAQHWALVNYIEKQKKKLKDPERNLSSPELQQFLNIDLTTCCEGKKKKVRTSEVRKRKRRQTDSSEDSRTSVDKAAHPRKKKKNDGAAIIPALNVEVELGNQLDRSSPNPYNNDEVVCTPDIMSMFSAEDPSKSTTPSTGHQPPPLIMRKSNPAMPTAPNSNVAQTPPTGMGRKTVTFQQPQQVDGTPSPVYHTINGFRIDLNSASQQETFRLPNGKLIQVKRQPVATNQPRPILSPAPIRPAQPHVLPQRPVTVNRPQIRTSVRPIIRQQSPPMLPTQITYRPILTPPIAGPPQQRMMMRPTLPNQQLPSQPIGQMGQMSGPPPYQVIRYSMPQQSTMPMQQPIQMQSMQSPQMLTTPAQNQSIPQISQIQLQMQTVINGQTVVQIKTFPNTALGQARAELEKEIYSSQEVCHHIVNKLNMLMNSNAYKNIKSLQDIKELYIHLSYLLTYTCGRFKTMQGRCFDDMRKLGFSVEAANLESGNVIEKYGSDDDKDEVEIVEPVRQTIEIDSDDDEPFAKISPAKTATPRAVNPKPVTTKLANSKVINPLHTSSAYAAPVVTATVTATTPMAQKSVASTKTTGSKVVKAVTVDIPRILNMADKTARTSTTVKLNRVSTPTQRVRVRPTRAEESDDENEIPMPPALEPLPDINIKTDSKLNSEAQVVLTRAEELFPYVSRLLNELKEVETKKLSEKSLKNNRPEKWKENGLAIKKGVEKAPIELETKTGKKVDSDEVILLDDDPVKTNPKNFEIVNKLNEKMNEVMEAKNGPERETINDDDTNDTIMSNDITDKTDGDKEKPPDTQLDITTESNDENIELAENKEINISTESRDEGATNDSSDVKKAEENESEKDLSTDNHSEEIEPIDTDAEKCDDLLKSDSVQAQLSVDSNKDIKNTDPPTGTDQTEVDSNDYDPENLLEQSELEPTIGGLEEEVLDTLNDLNSLEDISSPDMFEDFSRNGIDKADSDLKLVSIDEILSDGQFSTDGADIGTENGLESSPAVTAN